MKILAITNDELALSLIKSRVEALGHQFFSEKVKNEGVERLKKERFDVVFIDPTPLTSARPIIVNIKRAVSNYPYIFLISDSISQEEAVLGGANDLFLKPLDPASFDEKIARAVRILALVRDYGDDSLDFPSAGGVIAKSAFNQLFLSAMDRADRYGERTYVLRIYIDNYQDIVSREGPYAIDFAGAKLSKHLVLLRRQSDIIGQTGKYEYSLLLQRPIYETEPVEAANRFAESLAAIKDFVAPNSSAIGLTVVLNELPTGRSLAMHRLVFEPS